MGTNIDMSISNTGTMTANILPCNLFISVVMDTSNVSDVKTLL